MNKFLKIISLIVIIIVILFIGLFFWLSVTDFRPKEVEQVIVYNKIESKAPLELTIFDWNIGYGALGHDSDFFFDGGTTVITPEIDYNGYLSGIKDYISHSDADVYIFQEVDRDSKRSYYIDQLSELAEILPNFNYTFATNYKVSYIPPPALFKPAYGKVNAGISTFSKYSIDKAERISLPGSYKWPRSVLFLDRCMLVTNIRIETGENLVIINTHNSAYDQGGFIKKEQLKYIENYALTQFNKGNYVIIGGDWNSYMPGSDGDSFESEEKECVYNEGLPENWSIDGWTWGADLTVPSNRSLKNSYIEGQNFECIIDGFLLSPNIELKSVKTEDFGFAFSDHNPLEINIILK